MIGRWGIGAPTSTSWRCCKDGSARIARPVPGLGRDTWFEMRPRTGATSLSRDAARRFGWEKRPSFQETQAFDGVGPTRRCNPGPVSYMSGPATTGPRHDQAPEDRFRLRRLLPL